MWREAKNLAMRTGGIESPGNEFDDCGIEESLADASVENVTSSKNFMSVSVDPDEEPFVAD